MEDFFQKRKKEKKGKIDNTVYSKLYSLQYLPSVVASSSVYLTIISLGSRGGRQLMYVSPVVSLAVRIFSLLS